MPASTRLLGYAATNIAGLFILFWFATIKFVGRKRYLKAETVIRMLRHEVKLAGSQSEWARKTGVDRARVVAILSGNKPLSPTILKALKLRKAVVYEELS